MITISLIPDFAQSVNHNVVGDSARCARAPTKCLESSASSAVEESSTTYSALAVRFSFVAEWLSIASIVAATAARNPVEARSQLARCPSWCGVFRCGVFCCGVLRCGVSCRGATETWRPVAHGGAGDRDRQRPLNPAALAAPCGILTSSPVAASPVAAPAAERVDAGGPRRCGLELMEAVLCAMLLDMHTSRSTLAARASIAAGYASVRGCLAPTPGPDSPGSAAIRAQLMQLQAQLAERDAKRARLGDAPHPSPLAPPSAPNHLATAGAARPSEGRTPPRTPARTPRR